MKRLFATGFMLMLSTAARADELPDFFDSGVVGIMLEKSSESQLASSSRNCGNSIVQGYCFTNQVASEFLKLSVYPGNSEFQISYVEINAIDKLKTELSNYPVYLNSSPVFKTTKGIQLGMTKAEVIEILGVPSLEVDNEINYHASNSPIILKLYNMPLYDSKYVFVENELTQIKFGFQYP